jgi:hypothetical protein
MLRGISNFKKYFCSSHTHPRLIFIQNKIDLYIHKPRGLGLDTGILFTRTDIVRVFNNNFYKILLHLKTFHKFV